MRVAAGLVPRIDPYGGARDIEARVLRHVGPAFVEDPLRVLRAARFMARFAPLGFTVAPETMALMREMVASGELADLVPERVWQELRRSIAPSSAPTGVALSGLEDSLVDWLGEHDIDRDWVIAPALAGAGVAPEWLDRAAAAALAGGTEGNVDAAEAGAGDEREGRG